jgi:ABC-type dipeptide/oligopeptide/nickel transport system permease component
VLRYTLVRFGGMLAVLLVISMVTFVIMHSIPGGPFDAFKMPVSPQTLKNLNAKYGFDKPLYEQYFRYMWAALHGDLGVPFQSPGETVVGLLSRTWKVSAIIGGVSLIIAYVVGMPLGFISAVKQNTWVDHAATSLAILGVVTPSFVVSLVLILVLSLGLQWLPTGGWGESWQQAIMPVLAFSFGLVAIVARFTRNSVIEVLRSDFIRAARAKGLSQRAVLRRHVLRNALTPVVTIAGPMFAGVITGSFFIETIFRIPGIGQYFTTSAFQRDYPMIMALTLLYAILITMVYFITDIVYALIDPRVRIRSADAIAEGR